MSARTCTRPTMLLASLSLAVTCTLSTEGLAGRTGQLHTAGFEITGNTGNIGVTYLPPNPNEELQVQPTGGTGPNGESHDWEIGPENGEDGAILVGPNGNPLATGTWIVTWEATADGANSTTGGPVHVTVE